MDTAVEALMRAMLTEAWFTASDGDVEAPSGYFGYVRNEAAELAELREAFSETIDAYGNPSDEELIGSFVARINSDGILTVERMPTRFMAKAWYEARQEEFYRWASDDSDSEHECSDTCGHCRFE